MFLFERCSCLGQAIPEVLSAIDASIACVAISHGCLVRLRHFEPIHLHGRLVLQLAFFAYSVATSFLSGLVHSRILVIEFAAAKSLMREGQQVALFEVIVRVVSYFHLGSWGSKSLTSRREVV